ncbi:MAG TPA: sigma-70 family RNA polymerase sigma factor [Chloroflexota bacterium]
MSQPVALLDEERWLRAAREGDQDAFQRLVERYEVAAFNVALHTLRDRDEAADATQDAFLSAYRAIGQFRGGSFRAWLMRIVTNACLDIRRRAKRRPTSSLDALVEQIGEAPWADPTADDPEDITLSRERHAVIQAALSALPDEQQLAIVLVDIQGFSYEEAAQALDCAVGTVRSRLARGRVRVRDLLLEQGNFP